MSDYLAAQVPIAILLVAFVALCVFMLGLLLCRQALREQVTHWLVINILVADLLFSLCLRPATIKFELGTNFDAAQAFCRFYNILHQGELLGVPAMLLAYTIDRLLFVKDPQTYGRRMVMPLAIALLAVPWLLIIVIVCISAGGFAENKMAAPVDSIANASNVVYVCTFEYTQFLTGIEIFQASISLAMILCALVVTVLVLVFYCRLRAALNRNEAYSQLEAEVASQIRTATVIVCVLNLLFLVLFLGQFMVIELFKHHSLDPHILFLVFEVVEAICFLLLLTEIRSAAFALCCKKNRGEGIHTAEGNEQTSLNQVTNGEDTS